MSCESDTGEGKLIGKHVDSYAAVRRFERRSYGRRGHRVVERIDPEKDSGVVKVIANITFMPDEGKVVIERLDEETPKEEAEPPRPKS